MRYLKLLLPLILICNICFGRNNFAKVGDTLFPQMANPGYYGGVSGYTDQQIYALMVGAGAWSTRSVIDIYSYQQYGIGTFAPRFAYFYNTLGMRQNVGFLVCNTGPVYANQSTKLTAGGHRSIVPNGLFLNPYNPDSSINTANTWAKYCYDFVTGVGQYITYFQVWNEPDYTNTTKGGDSTVAGTWKTTKPVPDDIPNLYDSIEDYVQLAKIANQVIKRVKPSAKIITGGLGYAWFWQWIIRLNGAQWFDQLDIHSYPFYYWTTCVWNGTGCSPTAGAFRNSDVAANFVDSAFNAFRTVTFREGGPDLPMSTTEIAVPRWSFNPSNTPFPNNKYFGSSVCQENFLMKAFQILMQDSAKFVCMYQTGEDADSAQVSGTDPAGNPITPFSAMGLYKKLTGAGSIGHEVKTSQGVSDSASARTFANYTVNHTRPSAVSGTRVVEWDSSGNKILAAWAIVTHDTVETASGTIILPAGQTFTRIDKHGNIVATPVSGTQNIDGAVSYFRQIPGAVNNPPTVSAGANQNITANNTSVTGTAVANTGSITSTTWSLVSGPNTPTITTPSSLTTTITGLINGTYVFKLSATNSVPLTSSANATITVAITPLPPTAIASSSVGSITLPATDSLQLIGTGSFDNNPNGFISQYQWTLVNGKKGQIIRNPSSGNTYVVFDSVGTYTFQLKVFNNGGQSATAQVTVLVNQALVGLVANIQANNIVTLPLNQIFLNGTGSSDPNQNGVITNYQWNLNFSPPGSTATLNLQTNPIVTLAPVIPGTYIIQLTITDNLGQTGSVTVQITVNSDMIITNKVLKQLP
jgi:hypothetical protein